ncbi:hypothetical protein TNCV_2740241 [Trichonephila clavipes]|nr:hypothetical protein TNCV_2740241 [Trichonephila clavipes]
MHSKSNLNIPKSLSSKKKCSQIIHFKQKTNFIHQLSRSGSDFKSLLTEEGSARIIPQFPAGSGCVCQQLDCHPHVKAAPPDYPSNPLECLS